MIADKSDTIRRKAREILTARGWGVVTVSNGVAALMKLPTLDLAFILANISMPGKDGYEICDFIKNSPNLSHLPVFLTFNENEPYDEQRGTQVRADGKLKKKLATREPFESDELISFVARFIGKSQAPAPKRQAVPQAGPATESARVTRTLVASGVKPDVKKTEEKTISSGLLGQTQPTHEQWPTSFGRFPILVVAIIVLNLILFLLLTVAGGSTNTRLLVTFGALYRPLVDEGEYWRLLTAAFLHIGILHLLFNNYCLWALGSLLERLYGTGRFALIYLVSAISGSFLSLLFTEAVSAGASGAIFGVAGAMLVAGLRYESQIPGSLQETFGKGALPFIAYNVFYGFTNSGIDNFAHIGGLVGGACCALLLQRRQERPWTRRLAIAGFLVIFIASFLTQAESLVTRYLGKVREAAELIDAGK